MTQDHQVFLRIKLELWEKIKKQAQKENRTYTNMINTILRDYFKKGER